MKIIERMMNVTVPRWVTILVCLIAFLFFASQAHAQTLSPAGKTTGLKSAAPATTGTTATAVKALPDCAMVPDDDEYDICRRAERIEREKTYPPSYRDAKRQLAAEKKAEEQKKEKADKEAVKTAEKEAREERRLANAQARATIVANAYATGTAPLYAFGTAYSVGVAGISVPVVVGGGIVVRRSVVINPNAGRGRSATVPPFRPAPVGRGRR